MSNIPYSKGMTYKQYCSGLKSFKVIDSFSQIDEKVDFCGNKIDEISHTVDEIYNTVDEISHTGLGGGNSLPNIGRNQEIVFKYTIPPLQRIKLSEKCPFNGYITQVLRHWPSGCNALVNVAVGYDIDSFLPRSGTVAIDGATPETDVTVPVVRDNPIWVLLENSDSIFSHTITVTVTIREEVK